MLAFILGAASLGCPQAVEPYDRDARGWSDARSDDLEDQDPIDTEPEQPDAIDIPIDSGPADVTTDTSTDTLTDLPTDTPTDPIADPSADTPTDLPSDTARDPDAPTDIVPDPDLVADPTDPAIDPSYDLQDATADHTDIVDIPQDLPSGGTLLITEVCDPSFTSGARFVEIFNATGYAVNLSGWSLHFWDPNYTEPQIYTYPSQNLENGATFVVARDQVAFESVFPGRSANVYSTVINGNGNDTYVLVGPYGTVDIYGEIGNGSLTEPWNYSQSTAKRVITVILGNTTWQESEWTITMGYDTANPGSRY